MYTMPHVVSHLIQQASLKNLSLITLVVGGTL